MIRATLLFFFCLTAAQKLSAQNITGSWEGVSDGELVQINVLQDGDQLCGYTFDSVLNRRRDYCKAYFKGVYSKDTRTWLLTGLSFIANSGGHSLIRVKLWREPGDRKNELHANISIKSNVASFFGLGVSENTIMTKVSTNPIKPGEYPICFENQQPKSSSPQPATVPEKTKPTAVEKKTTPVQPPVTKAPVDPIKKETEVTPQTVVISPVTKPIEKVTATPELKAMAARKQTEVSRVKVSVKHLRLEVYDNGTVDNDTVTIFYNGRVIANRQWLSEKAVVLEVDLDESAPLHQITMYANNLGSIPPNTALIIVTAGDKRFELRSKASLEENAVLVFEYAPD